MASAKRKGKRTFIPPCTLAMNQSQSLKQSLLRPSSSRNKHSHNGNPSVHEKENVSYTVGEKGTPSVNLQNDSDFNAGVNEDDHLTPLQPQGSTNKSVCTLSPDKEGREDEKGREDERLSLYLAIDHTEAEIDGSNSMNNKKKWRNFKPCGPNTCKRLANLKNGEKLELIYFHNGPVGENRNLIIRHMCMLVEDYAVCAVCVRSWNDIDKSAKEHMWAMAKDKFMGKDVELDREATLRHMKRLWHY
ncbi:hypothetical protein Cgig2_025237 [Carnegiea gigantea]|uniref:Uncharacterized protein n=1 Tax=Carnegiea gigantea TaxID=171969 RepID=A0A9Q1JID2_9CARY|nr:hypothetical protein Cgig2_025237 [Carnegiea gigantea]